MGKIDIHVHALPRRASPDMPGIRFPTPGELRRIYDAIGVDRGVIQCSVAPECSLGLVTNEDAVAMYEAHPETFYWFCGIDPRWLTNSLEADFTGYLHLYRERGARGVGEVTANLYMDDPRVYNLFAQCEACGMPVTLHLGDPGFGDYGLIDEMGLPRLEKALAAFPKLTFLGHSQKFWAEISGDLTAEQRGGYPKGRVVPGGRLVTLFERYPNLCGDLSATSGCNALLRDPEFACTFVERFQDRLFFGTDLCSAKQATSPMLRLSPWLDEMAEAGNISRAAYENVSRENALRLLGDA